MPRWPKKDESDEPKIVTLNADLISDDQKKLLREKARKMVSDKRLEAAEDDFLKEAMRQEELADKPDEQLEYIMLDLAGHSEYIMLDGVRYFHGTTYEVTRSVGATMREIIARGWQHEQEIGGANRDLYRRPLELRLKGGMENMTANSIMGRR